MLIVCTALLAGCTPATGVSRNSPYGADSHGQGVDGMTVGHRLMAAGDYIEGPYPATLEGAVRAGEAALALLLRP